MISRFFEWAERAGIFDPSVEAFRLGFLRKRGLPGSRGGNGSASSIRRITKPRASTGGSKIPVAALCVLGGTAACARLSGVGTPEWEVPTTDGPRLYTATNFIRSFAIGKDAIWAATEGGVVRWTYAPSSPRKWTTADGLVSDDVRTLTIRAQGSVVARSPSGFSEIAGEEAVVPLVSETPRAAPSPTGKIVRTTDGVLEATTDGLFYTPRGGERRRVPLPAVSRASHVSALAVVTGKKREYFAGLYGDGVYRIRFGDDKEAQWQRLPLPDTCRFVTALAVPSGGGLLIGTRDNGAFTRSADGTQFHPLPSPNSLPSADIYSIAPFRGHLYVGTFDQGVFRFAPNGTTVVYPYAKQARAMAPFGNDLYVLQADHSVWKFDGADWKPAWEKFALRRADVYSLALDRVGRRLLIGGFGGWAEYDGQTWRQHWNTPGLEGESITAIAADASGAIWVGTQRRGLFRCTGDTATAFQEAHGLTDDWITSIAVSPKGRLLVGTYTGGLLEREGDRFVQRLAVEKWAMRRVVFDGERALVATPVGLYREGDSHRWEKIDPRLTGGPEIQALLPAEGGVWVGTRNGLAFAIPPRPPLSSE